MSECAFALPFLVTNRYRIGKPNTKMEVTENDREHEYIYIHKRNKNFLEMGIGSNKANYL